MVRDAPARADGLQIAVSCGAHSWEFRVTGTWVPDDGALAHDGPLANDDDLTAACAWGELGHGVEQLLRPEELHTIRRNLAQTLAHDLRSSGVPIRGPVELTRYHRLVGSDEAHARVVARRAGRFPLQILGVDIEAIERRVSSVLGRRVQTLVPKGLKPSIGVRVVRPGSQDCNPPHRDSYLTRLRNSVTVYVPVAGSNDLTSLTVRSGSHLRSSPTLQRSVDGAVIDTTTYSVPATRSTTSALVMTRPPVGETEALFFSPYLIHGGAANLSEDTTRVSLELRFAAAGTT